VENEGRKCILIRGDLEAEEHCLEVGGPSVWTGTAMEQTARSKAPQLIMP
jgi:hypothetical protein